MYGRVIEWKSLSSDKRVLIAASTVFMILSGSIFMFMDEACFRPFQVNNSIGAGYDENGLNGQPLSIVKMPGWGAMALFALACVLHGLFLRIASRETAALMRRPAPPSRSSGARRGS
mmetsp:Transcript_13507/g.30618  ORF Transcript_13507/g.30618 Transcript_13507/m.30618 type:complete len:117 (+) Transcript_13507:1-351(+)